MPRKTGRKQAPAHQNAFKFKHNKGSKKTKKILSLPTTGLCLKCYEKIQWRKEYRKYKPITHIKKCATCKEPRITQAYHIFCKRCANGKCEKCGQERERDVIGRDEVQQKLSERMKDLEVSLTGIKERDRRKIVRKLKDEIMEERKGDNDSYDYDSGNEDAASHEEGEGAPHDETNPSGIKPLEKEDDDDNSSYDSFEGLL